MVMFHDVLNYSRHYLDFKLVRIKISVKIVKMSENQLLTKDQCVELAQKNSDRTYISIHENVYDITTFLDEVSPSPNSVRT